MAYSPRAYARTAVPAASTLHGLQRFSGGYTPGLSRQVAAAGGFERWFRRQLADGYDDDWYAATAKWWPSLNASVATRVLRHHSGVEPFWVADAHYQRWTMVRRIGSQRQVRETMADFWEHHLHVPARGEVGPFRASYGKTIRANALGTFRDLLQATITHPAMSVYLTNANSSKTAPNENLGRELLELHTVGRGHYTEDDVKNSARILTGYRINLWQDWVDSYDPSKHWTGTVRVMDFQHANTAPDGRPVVKAYLDHLARHPATARRIARKLAIRFVSDTPSDALVERLAAVYLANDTAIGPVLTALIATSEFKASARKKVRTPAEDVVATWRALGARFTAGPSSADDNSGATCIMWQATGIGLGPLSWQRPDGRPDHAAAWSTTSRFLASLAFHQNMAGGWWPVYRTSHRRPVSWLPARRIRFDQFVDHLARSIHGRRSDSRLLQAACEATGLLPGTIITSRHALMKWGMPRLLTLFLDSPIHMTR